MSTQMGHNGEKVILRFNQQLGNLKLTPQAAREWAANLVSLAEMVENTQRERAVKSIEHTT